MTVGQRLNCKRCGHKWYARAAGRPVQCPRCKSPAWDRTPMVSDVKGKYKPGSRVRQSKRKEPSIRRGTQDFVDFSKLPAFGMWKDLTETDEELLNRLGGGWGSPEEWSETDEE